MKRGLTAAIKIAVGAVIGFAFLSVGSIFRFRQDSKKNLVQIEKNLSLQFEADLNEQLALSVQLSKSPLIKSYFEDPANEILKELAFKEISSYQDSFISGITFMINDNDLTYYSNNKPLYILDKSDPSSVWYVETMKMNKPYDFNVDFDIGLGKTYLWVNAIVRNSSGNSIGLIGTGIPISDFVDTMYRNLPKDSLMFTYNDKLEITGSKNIQHLEKKEPIINVISDLKGKESILREKGNNFIVNQKAVYSIAPLASIGWNIIVYKQLTVGEFFKSMSTSAVIFLTVLIAVIIFKIMNTIITPVRQITKTTVELSSGDADLTKRINLKSQTLPLLVNMCGGFNEFIKQLQDSISSVKDSKDNLVSKGANLNECSQSTVNSINSIIENIVDFDKAIEKQTSSVHDTANSVDQVSDNINALLNLIDTQGSSVYKASSAIEQMVHSISSVDKSVNTLSESYKTLEGNIQRGISKQIEVNTQIEEVQAQSKMLQDANTVISTIAAKTNLLAMNAAIEAAHAGESGKGFSVVADEIRSLAENSAEQSRTIGEQLSQIVTAISNIVGVSKESTGAFDQVSSEIKSTGQIVQQISNAMREQSSGSDEITQALSTLNNATSEVKNASSVMTNESKEILVQMKNLQSSTELMKQSMTQMNQKAQVISETEKALSEITVNMENSITQIGDELDRFKV